MVDDKLEAAKGTTLADYIADERAAGNTVEESLALLRELTGVPVALRTLWLWLKTDEESRAS